VMALFGAPVAHEDHARRACRAALDIQRRLGEYGNTVERDTSLPFKMRIGLHSGPVIVGAIGNDLRMDYAAVGDTTNLASRILQTITGMREDLKSQLMNLKDLEFIYEKHLFSELEYIYKTLLKLSDEEYRKLEEWHIGMDYDPKIP